MLPASNNVALSLTFCSAVYWAMIVLKQERYIIGYCIMYCAVKEIFCFTGRAYIPEVMFYQARQSPAVSTFFKVQGITPSAFFWSVQEFSPGSKKVVGSSV
jgi:hypothetical protein